MKLAKIRNQHSDIVIESCCEGCKLGIRKRMERVMIKGEGLTKSEKICDCIIFQGDGKIILVELKDTRKLVVEEIAEKFLNGGRKALSIASRFEKKGNYKIKCILLARGYKPMAKSRIDREKIRLNGTDHKIKRGRCGCYLEEFV